jgi:hypothetical protein
MIRARAARFFEVASAAVVSVFRCSLQVYRRFCSMVLVFQSLMLTISTIICSADASVITTVEV